MATGGGPLATYIVFDGVVTSHWTSIGIPSTSGEAVAAKNPKLRKVKKKRKIVHQNTKKTAKNLISKKADMDVFSPEQNDLSQ